MGPALVEEFGQGVVSTVQGINGGLLEATGHGILFYGGVLAVIGVGIYGVRKLVQGVTG